MAPAAPRYRYAMSDGAYAKAVLHAAKHTGAVHGVLLACEAGGRVTIVDALPVAHSALAAGTAPTTDMALHLARAHADVQGLVVAGAYYAPDVADDGGVPVLPTRLADHLRASCEFACLLLLDAQKLHPRRRCGEQCFRLCTMDGGPKSASWGKGKWDTEVLEVSPAVLAACDSWLKDSPASAQSVVDFEEHCMDPSRDWLNPSTEIPL
jgi:Uncharacterised protein family (UPF0172)